MAGVARDLRDWAIGGWPLCEREIDGELAGSFRRQGRERMLVKMVFGLCEDCSEKVVGGGGYNVIVGVFGGVKRRHCTGLSLGPDGELSALR